MLRLEVYIYISIQNYQGQTNKQQINTPFLVLQQNNLHVSQYLPTIYTGMAIINFNAGFRCAIKHK